MTHKESHLEVIFNENLKSAVQLCDLYSKNQLDLLKDSIHNRKPLT
jgi:hypothetical protein